MTSMVTSRPTTGSIPDWLFSEEGAAAGAGQGGGGGGGLAPGSDRPKTGYRQEVGLNVGNFRFIIL